MKDNPPEEIKASEFKAKCLQLMDQVQATGKSITITKYGKPVASLVPEKPAVKESLLGCMKGQITIAPEVDLTEPIAEFAPENWSVFNGDDGHLYESLPEFPKSPKNS